MKKLLEVLGAISLTISAPISVIACNQENTEEDNKIDYNLLKNKLKDSSQLILNQNLEKDFDPFLFVQEGSSNSPFSTSIKWLTVNKEFIEEVGTDEYNLLKSDIDHIINHDKINAALKEELANNVNYRPILINNSPPLTDIGVEKLEIVVKERSVTINAQVGANFQYKNALGDLEIERMSPYKVAFSVLKQDTDVATLNEMKDEFKNVFRNSEDIMQFYLKVDSGNLEKNADRIETRTDNNLIYKKIEEMIKVINRKFKDKNIRIESDYLLKVDRNNALDASAGFNRLATNWNYPNEATNTVIDAFLGDSKAEEYLLERITNNKTDWYTNSVSRNIPEMDELVKKHKSDEMSVLINSYNLDFNLASSSFFQTAIKDYRFSLNPEEEPSLVALYLSKLTNVNINYDGEIFDLNPVDVFVKQLPESRSTLMLVDKFITASWKFIKTFCGFNEFSSHENNPDFLYYINKPESWNDLPPNTKMDCETAFEDLVNANPKAKAYLEPMELIAMMSPGLLIEKYKTLYAGFNENGDVYFFDRMKDSQGDCSRIAVQFYSWGLNEYANKIEFSVRGREDKYYYKVFEDESPFKFKEY